jgi:transcriptional regulator GlxA family with amidase domain
LHILGLLGKIVEKTATQLPSSLDAPTRGDDDLVAQAITIIWTRGHQPLSVEQIAHASGVTRRTLERRFQQTLGHSIVDEIIDCRMNRAKRLLQETAMPIKYVAYLSGFPSAERMRVAFVERENVSPAAYREKIVKT